MRRTALIIIFAPFLIGSTCNSNNDAYVAPGFNAPQNSLLKNGSIQILEAPREIEL